MELFAQRATRPLWGPREIQTHGSQRGGDARVLPAEALERDLKRLFGERDDAPEGQSSSRIKKTEADTDNAQSAMTTHTVMLRGARSPKLAKITASQDTTTTMNGVEMVAHSALQ